jgi:pantoate--beta-alanine ligase
VFAPPVEQMYPPGEHTRVRVGALGEALCGRTRPGHFEGVATVVSKLFNVAGSCVAVFGRKDYQQLKVVERMARDLLFDVEVLPAPTVRDRDGVALSSRNAYLGAGERTAARAIPRALSSIIERHRAGERRVVALLDPARAELERAGLRLDYVELADADEIEPFEPHARIGERALAAIAAYAGSTRLIDNVVLGEDDAPLATRDTSSTE